MFQFFFKNVSDKSQSAKKSKEEAFGVFNIYSVAIFFKNEKPRKMFRFFFKNVSDKSQSAEKSKEEAYGIFNIYSVANF